MNSSYHAFIKRVEEKYEALYGLAIAFDDIFNMSDVVITLLQESFKKFVRDGVANDLSENVALLVQ